MSFLLALQSVLFYVAACSPCHQAMHQRHLKQEAKKQREAKEQSGPDLEGYQQPEPFSTNPYWSEEIRRKENEKPIASVRLGSDIMSATSPDPDGSTTSSERYRLSPDMTFTLPPNWNHKRYQIPNQREDEELWGSELSRTGHKLMDAIKHAGSSSRRFIESSLYKDIRVDSDDENDDGHYFVPVNPPVNDYHPPIVRRPPFKGAVQWMVQPPPPAKVMEGKVPVSRGSSVSNSVRRDPSGDKALDGIPLSRRTLSRGSSVSNLSRHTTASDSQKTGPPMTLQEMI
ncbi:hypothetical protein ONZ43_g3247 [Nemania bipapillata]|uniref:Uncharacterized protein n=1 Tax=Nemania bipapillata TaxID=110536 RepID=A0ACC2IXV5_9PEZI|nr:hypothetical protein ONZ43_g3247 [Nemania bipapillata]